MTDIQTMGWNLLAMVGYSLWVMFWLVVMGEVLGLYVLVPILAPLIIIAFYLIN